MLRAQGDEKGSLLPFPDSSGSKHSPDLLDSPPEAQRKLRREAVIWRIQPHLRQLSQQIRVMGEAGRSTRRWVSDPGSAAQLLCDIEQVTSPLWSLFLLSLSTIYFCNKCVPNGVRPLCLPC